ncbi:hypothetical protein LCGC14_0569030 [marine sediment metagenome]|uniref:Uncharacterized protein n=1 Tax=marine sediment metagenome TaxID=412755 RepID=A0A0F9RPX9_9ZZZZ|nr:hypothetical protein [Candidatus Aminicenantes bacterium]HEB35947.1 hypothetical protein [Candidatus Aminicenantes bacterium]
MKRILTSFPRWMAIFTLAAFLGAVAAPASAQDHEGEDGEDLQEFLAGLSMDAASKYVAPIVSAFGMNLNGGWFHKAPSAKKFGFNVEVGLVGMATFYPKGVEHLSFDTSGDFRFSTAQAEQLIQSSGLVLPLDVENALIAQITQQNFTVNISGATVIGDPTDYIEIDFSGADITFTDPGTGLPRTETLGIDVITLPIGGFAAISDLSFLPLAAPQLSLGTVLGTRVTFRYLPSITLDEELGKFKYFGFGIQHNPGVLLPTPLPFDVGVGYFTQTLEIGTLFKAKTTAFGINASKRLGVGAINITPYAGFMLETSNIDITYDFILDEGTIDEQVIPIAFELEGENRSRITLGLSIRLLMLNFNADYNIGKYNSVTVGVMFTI